MAAPRVVCARPLRLAGCSYTGFQRYLLTLCTFERRPAFHDANVVHAVLLQIRQLAGEHDFSILAYCFMPDHLHLVAAANSARARLKPFVSLMKQRTAYSHMKQFGQHLWQPGYHDRVLRNEESTVAVVRYVLENPIRARLAPAIEEYPFCGSDLWLSRILRLHYPAGLKARPTTADPTTAC